MLALVALTSILLLGGIFSEATRNGLSPGQVLAVIPLLIPNTFPYTLPTTTLFATCVIYGRLAHDNEILAMKAAGINLTHVVWPAVLLGTLASIGTFVLYMDTIPYTHNILRTSFMNDVELLYMTLKRDGCLAPRQARLRHLCETCRGEDSGRSDVHAAGGQRLLRRHRLGSRGGIARRYEETGNRRQDAAKLRFQATTRMAAPLATATGPSNFRNRLSSTSGPVNCAGSSY